MLRRSARLQEKALKKQADCLYPLIKNMEDAEDAEDTEDTEDTVIPKLKRRNGVVHVYSAKEDDESIIDFIVYGIFKFELGDKRANLAKKRLQTFFFLTVAFIAARALLFSVGFLCQKKDKV